MVIILALGKDSDDTVLIGCIVVTGFGGIVQTYFWIYAYSLWEDIITDGKRIRDTCELKKQLSLKMDPDNKRNHA